MNITSSSRARFLLARAFTCVAVVSLLAACESAESKQMKAIAGDYVTLYESEIPPGQQQPFVSQRNTLTLRPDGRWVEKIERRILDEEKTITDSGAYRVQGTMLALGATEQEPSVRMTISGDTLWSNGSSSIKAAEAVTGVKVNDSGEQGFMVRQR